MSSIHSTAQSSPILFGRILALSIFLTGCTTWTKPGTSPQELNMATTHCEAASYGLLPANNVTDKSTGASYSERKKCEKNSANGCIKKNGKYYEIIRTMTDTNSEGRSAVFRDCMVQSGWRPE
jgi:hypothetical protein